MTLTKTRHTPPLAAQMAIATDSLRKVYKGRAVVQGLTHKFSNEGHWGSTVWLTGANRYAQPGQSFHNSISADQVAAAQFGLHTRFASLQFNHSEEGDRSGHGPRHR